MKILPLMCLLASLSTLCAQTISPLDARLDDYAYAYPTATFAFTSQGQDLEMAYIDEQPDNWNGETVVLLHGKNFNSDYWAETIALLLRENYRVIAPDQIGFGKSSKPEQYHYSFHGLADNTRNLLTRLGVDRATVLGHSMGGMLATRFALLYPERVQQLVLLNPIGLEDWQRQVPYRPFDWWYQRELKKDYVGIKTYMRESYYDGEWRPAYDPPVELLAGWAKGPDSALIAHNAALTYDMIFTQPVVHEFDRLRVPTLLIIGTRDRTALGKDLVSEEVRATLGRYDRLGKTTAETIPDATLVELEGLGHLPHFEDFSRFSEALLGHLPAATAPTYGSPELVHTTEGVQSTGITVTDNQRVFLTFPRWRKGVPYTLAEVVNGEVTPYPNASINDWKMGAAAGAKLVNVQSAVAVGDTLYVADTRNPMFAGLVTQPQVHLYDLRTNKKLRTYELSSAATTKATYINDLRIDRQRGLVYFTDSGRPGLIVLDLSTGESWRHLDNHYSTQAEVDTLRIIDGSTFTQKTPSDGIALDVAKDRLLYHALSGYSLYAIPLDRLADRDTVAARRSRGMA